MSNTEQRYTMFINTTVEDCWNAITNPEFSRQYWAGHANTSDWQKDSVWQHEDTKDNNNVRVTGRVLESVPHKRLVISWHAPGNEGDVSKVTFEMQTISNLVRLDVVHDGFKQDSEMAGAVSKGWPAVLCSMKTYLETGTGLDLVAVFGANCAGKAA